MVAANAANYGATTQPTFVNVDKVFYFHNDISGMPEELTSDKGELTWLAQYSTWGNTVRENWYRSAQEQIESHGTVPLPQNLRFQGQYLDRETGLHYNTFRFYDPDIGRFISLDPIGLMGGDNLYNYAANPVSWIDPLGLSCSSYKGKVTMPASKMTPLIRGSREWKNAIVEMQMAIAGKSKFQVKVHSSTDAKAFLREAQLNMNRYKAHTQSARADGIPKYPKGYEQHMAPEGGFNNTPHIKYYNNGTDGHIFYNIPN